MANHPRLGQCSCGGWMGGTASSSVDFSDIVRSVLQQLQSLQSVVVLSRQDHTSGDATENEEEDVTFGSGHLIEPKGICIAPGYSPSDLQDPIRRRPPRVLVADAGTNRSFVGGCHGDSAWQRQGIRRRDRGDAARADGRGRRSWKGPTATGVFFSRATTLTNKSRQDNLLLSSDQHAFFCAHAEKFMGCSSELFPAEKSLI
eukprot:2137703-Rhodomonas_salina.1